MKTEEILNVIDSVIVLPPAVKELIEEKVKAESDKELTSDDMDRFEKVNMNLWQYKGHYLRLYRRALVTPTSDCKVKFWVHTVRDLEAALSFIDNDEEV